MESVGLKDRCLNQKQIHTILTDTKQRRYTIYDTSSSSEDESDDSDSSNTETGTISEEYTVDSD